MKNSTTLYNDTDDTILSMQRQEIIKLKSEIDILKIKEHELTNTILQQCKYLDARSSDINNMRSEIQELTNDNKHINNRLIEVTHNLEFMQMKYENTTISEQLKVSEHLLNEVHKNNIQLHKQLKESEEKNKVLINTLNTLGIDTVDIFYNIRQKNCEDKIDRLSTSSMTEDFTEEMYFNMHENDTSDDVSKYSMINHILDDASGLVNEIECMQDITVKRNKETKIIDDSIFKVFTYSNHPIDLVSLVHRYIINHYKNEIGEILRCAEILIEPIAQHILIDAPHQVQIIIIGHVVAQRAINEHHVLSAWIEHNYYNHIIDDSILKKHCDANKK